MSMEFEFISHRSNVSFLGTGRGDGKKFLGLKRDRLAVYAERCYSLGKYGGDAYPVVWEKEYDNVKYGIVLAADGVGQASYDHPSLKIKLDAKLEKEFGKVFTDAPESERDALRLSAFLKELLGIDITKTNDAAAEEELNYAMRSFSLIPVGGYFGGRTSDENGGDVEEQTAMQFYLRQSQAIGSRLTCAWIFKNFRAYALEKKLKKWTAKDADELRQAILNSLYEGEDSLVSRTRKFFSYDDTQKADRINFYFLPATVAAWFYIDDGKKISAVALNCGDARCYKVDLKDGVKQISDDDIASDGDKMSAFVHYGKILRSEKTGYKGYYDGTFRAAIVHLDAPCALFACSDGIYDTCPEEWAPSGRALGNSAADCSDILFEYRMLKAFRRSYSLDDLSDEVVYSFYGQDAPKGLEKKIRYEWGKAGAGMNVKKDDSGTFAAKLFSAANDPMEVFDGLRAKKDTTLDILIDAAQRHDMPIKDMHWQSPEALCDEEFSDMAREWVQKYDFVEALGKLLPKEELLQRKENGEETYRGVNLQKFDLSRPQRMLFRANAVGIINYLLDNCNDKTAYPELYALLVKYNVEAGKKEAYTQKIDYPVEEMRRKYELLTKSFYGALADRENRDDIIFDDGRHVENIDADVENIVATLKALQQNEARQREEEARKAEEERLRKEAEERAAEEARMAELERQEAELKAENECKETELVLAHEDDGKEKISDGDIKDENILQELTEEGVRDAAFSAPPAENSEDAHTDDAADDAEGAIVAGDESIVFSDIPANDADVSEAAETEDKADLNVNDGADGSHTFGAAETSEIASESSPKNGAAHETPHPTVKRYSPPKIGTKLNAPDPKKTALDRVPATTGHKSPDAAHGAPRDGSVGGSKTVAKYNGPRRTDKR